MLKISTNGDVYCERRSGSFVFCSAWLYTFYRCPDCPMKKVITAYLERVLALVKNT